MPNSKDPDRKHNRRKLQRAKELLMCRHITKQPFSSLCQTKHRPEIYEETRTRHRKHKHIFPSDIFSRAEVFANRDPKQQQDKQKDRKGSRLDSQPSEQDVVARLRIPVIRLGGPNQSRAGNLHTSRQNVRGDEAPQDQFGRQPPAPVLVVGYIIIERGRRGPRDESIDGKVDAGRDEDGRHDDEEVLHHEPDDAVRVVLRGKRAEYIAGRFKKARQR